MLFDKPVELRGMLTGIATKIIKSKNKDDIHAIVLEFGCDAETILPELGATGLAIRKPDTKEIKLNNHVESVVKLGTPGELCETEIGRENDAKAVTSLVKLVNVEDMYVAKLKIAARYSNTLWAWAGQRFACECVLAVRQFQADLPFDEVQEDKGRGNK